MKTLNLGLAVCVIMGASSAFAIGKDPTPKLYPNKHLSDVGEAQANRDIADCSGKANSYVQNSHKSGDGLRAGTRSAAKGAVLGTVGGAIMGNTGRGAAAGAAVGATSSAIKGVRERGPRDPAFQQYVNTCLEDKGYKVIQWN